MVHLLAQPLRLKYVWKDDQPKTWLDTSSPVSIVSTEFLLKALMDIKKKEKSKEERLKDIESKLKSPTVNIHNLEVVDSMYLVT